MQVHDLKWFTINRPLGEHVKGFADGRHGGAHHTPRGGLAGLIGPDYGPIPLALGLTEPRAKLLTLDLTRSTTR